MATTIEKKKAPKKKERAEKETNMDKKKKAAPVAARLSVWNVAMASQQRDLSRTTLVGLQYAAKGAQATKKAKGERRRQRVAQEKLPGRSSRV